MRIRIFVSTNWPGNNSRLTDGRSDACLYCPNAVELLAALRLFLRIDSAIFEMINLLPTCGSQLLRRRLAGEGFGAMRGDVGEDVVRAVTRRMIGGPCDEACRRQWEPLHPPSQWDCITRPRSTRSTPRRHHSCLTEIPSYTASGQIPFSKRQSPGHSMACGAQVFHPPYPAGLAIKMPIHMRSPATCLPNTVGRWRT